MTDENEDSTTYPRPDFRREVPKWRLCLKWSIAFDDQDEGLQKKWYLKHTGIPKNKKVDVKVPFVYQTTASGIDKQVAHQIVWYETELFSDVTIEDDLKRGDAETVLCFGAVDYHVTVWLDGQLLGTHSGGHVPFDLAIPPNVLDGREETTLTVRVWDAATDLTQPRGKQYWGPKPESIFYTPSTGIWQPVWTEDLPITRIANSSNGTVIRSNDIESGDLQVEIAIQGRRQIQPAYVAITASLAGIEVAESEWVEVDKEKDIARLSLNLQLDDDQMSKLPQPFKEDLPISDVRAWHNNLALWSPEHPTLYDLKIVLAADRKGHKVLDTVITTTGMRSLSWSHGDGTFRLNGKPYFQALVLDQGYWPNTNMTPPTHISCKEDILLAKAMGFNGCRKHQKVESPEFMYWADRLGFLVWGEMANSYEFSKQYVERFDQEWSEAVRRDINHPCVVAWTPVNETWGYGDLANDVTQQNHIRSLYYQTKTMDPTRPINDNCGWEHVVTDLTTFHDYADGPQLADTCASLQKILGQKAGRDMFVGGAIHKEGAPILCTEFGGVNIALKKGEQGVNGEWGYTTASDPQDLLQRVKRLMLSVVEGGHCCGFVYTQLTDIEQETNGLYTFEREEKLPSAEVKKIIEEVKRVYFEKLAARQK